MHIKSCKKSRYYLSYLLVFLIIFFSTKTSTFSSSTFLTRLLICSLLLFWVFTRLRVGKKIISFALFYFAFSIIICFKYEDTYPFFDFLFFFIDVILLVYLTLKIVGSNFFYIYEKIVYNWSLFIFPLYLFQLIVPETIFKLNIAVGSFFNVISANVERKNYSNSIFFTMINGVYRDRNCGFMWEPGAFGAILIIALVICLYANKFKLNAKVVVYLVIILSTYSTTAYLNLVLVPFFYLFNSNTRKNIFVGSVIIIFATIFLSLSSTIVVDKINFQLSNLENDLIRLDNNLEGIVVLDRFASLVYLAPAILDNYLIGTGWSVVNDIALEKDVYLSNGVAFYFVMFGIVGFLFFIYNLYKTGLAFFRRNKKMSILFIIIILNIGFSNPVLMLPFFVSLQVYGYIDFQHKFITGYKVGYKVFN